VGTKLTSVKDILIEMKNLSELMVDLAYSAILFNDKEVAEEVLKLENKINGFNYEIKVQSLIAAHSLDDAEKLTSLLEIAEATESIANSAKDMADLTLKGLKPHPVFKMVMEESEEIVSRISISKGSELSQKSLGDLLLATRTGMRIIAIRRYESWIYGPDKNTVLLEEDTLIFKGTESGSDILKKIAQNKMSFEDI
jgi:uncharacterized protein with PhoU and TrkA domain